MVLFEMNTVSWSCIVLISCHFIIKLKEDMFDITTINLDCVCILHNTTKHLFDSVLD